MNGIWSISFSYKMGLGFHALNNEGADGGNLMQPRKIDVGFATYDGISGEIIRRHILENFVNICSSQKVAIPILPMSAGLHPDRGPIGIRAAAKQIGNNELTDTNLYSSVREAIRRCAVLDVGGYLAAWKEQSGSAGKEYIVEKPYIDSECAPYKDAEPVKRESCFDVAWLISETPQELTVTQHSAFRNTFSMNSRYSQTMRSNIYGGVIRADLHRIGTDDYWYLQPGENGHGSLSRLAINDTQQKARQKALIEAIANFVLSPTGAKVAAWAPHVFLTEGAVILSSKRTAPFVSPITVNLRGSDSDNKEPSVPIQANLNYRNAMKKLANEKDLWCWEFTDAAGLVGILPAIFEILDPTDGSTKAK